MQVLGSDDGSEEDSKEPFDGPEFDGPDFDAIAFVNSQFPDERSLSKLDVSILVLEEQIRALDRSVHGE